MIRNGATLLVGNGGTARAAAKEGSLDVSKPMWSTLRLASLGLVPLLRSLQKPAGPGVSHIRSVHFFPSGRKICQRIMVALCLEARLSLEAKPRHMISSQGLPPVQVVKTKLKKGSTIEPLQFCVLGPHPEWMRFLFGSLFQLQNLLNCKCCLLFRFSI